MMTKQVSASEAKLKKMRSLQDLNAVQGVVIATNATHSRNDIVVSDKTANDYLSSFNYGEQILIDK
ncbi:MAG: hypothetical protein IJR46_03990 [Neisseriaceae bacterium]|nr:hypothetical protein [Neisseriaceae bacterium]